MTHDDISDAGLKKSILEMLGEEGYDTSHIKIEVEDGVVYLSGEVETEDDREEIDELVSDMIGVEEVSNELIIDTSDDATDFEDENDDGNESLDPLDEPDEGTTDPTQASEEGIPFIPPDRPFYR